MAKKNTGEAATQVVAASPTTYQIVGLQPADRMPIVFRGRVYDLARLSAEDAAYLLEFPQQVPYLKSTNVSGPVTGAADV